MVCVVLVGRSAAEERLIMRVVAGLVAEYWLVVRVVEGLGAVREYDEEYPEDEATL